MMRACVAKACGMSTTLPIARAFARLPAEDHLQRGRVGPSMLCASRVKSESLSSPPPATLLQQPEHVLYARRWL